MKIFSYFCPFSKEFNSCRDYARLSGGQKALTILATIGATLASLPFLGFGGVAVFRAMVEKYSFKKIDPKGGGDSEGESVARDVHSMVHPEGNGFVGAPPAEGERTPEKAGEEPSDDEDAPVPKEKKNESEKGVGTEKKEARTVRRFATLDDGCMGVSKKMRRFLYNREDLTIDEGLEKKETVPAVKVKRVEAEEVEPKREVRGPEGKEEEIEPKEVQKHLDALSLDERGDIARSISRELSTAIHKRNETFLQDVHERFMRDVQQVIPKAVELHRHFLYKFIGTEGVPFVDRKTGMAYSTLYQLKTAIKMAQDQFPGLTTLTFREEQRIAVGRLIQIIMCGEEVVELPLPSSSCCFQLLELQGKHSPSVPMKYEDAESEENISFLDFMMHNIESNSHKKPENEHLRANMMHAADLLVNDSIIRKLNTFHFGDVVIPLGQRGEENNNDPAAFVQVMNEAYTKYLLANPDKTKEIVSANQSSKYLQKLCELFIDNEEKSALEKSGMPEIVLEKLFNRCRELHSESPAIVSTLMNLYLYSRIDEKTVKEIAGKSGCDPKDVEPLVRIKLLELMILMNQSGLADGCGVLHQVLSQYGIEMERSEFFPTGISNDFVIPVSEEPMSSDFNDFENRTQFSVGLLDSGEEGVEQCFPGQLTVAEVFVNDQLRKFNSPQGDRSIIAMQGLCLSWLSSTDIMDFLAKQIDPESVKQQPDVKYPDLKEAMKQAQEKLDLIARNAQPFTLSKIISCVTGETDSSSLKEDTKTIDEIERICREYLRVVSQIEIDENEVVEVVKGLRNSLTNAAMALQNLKRKYEENDALEDVKSMLQKIDRLLSSLPETESKVEGAGASYFDRLRGVFIESNDPVEVMWRVKKYESQILELRQAIKESFQEILDQEEEEDVDGSWCKVGNNSQTIVKELYDILNGIHIDLRDEERFVREYLAKLRENYNEKFLPRLRQAVMEEGDNFYVQTLCELLFTRVSLENECMETIGSFDRMGANELHQKVEGVDSGGQGNHEFVKRLHALYERVYSAPYSAKQPLLEQLINSARGQWNYDFDPYRQGNPVHVLYQLLIGEKAVKALGMGTPTIEGRDGVAQLAPEFIGFVRSYKGSNKKHLFVLNQNPIPKKGIAASIFNGDETARCDLILDAQERDDLKGAVFAIALSKNSEFYSQKGFYKDRNNAETFMKTLYDEIFVKPRHESGCYIPQGVRDSIKDFDERAQAIIQAIHTEVFNDVRELNVEERKHFIELYYDHLTKFIIKELDIDSFNISCKDAIDRGAGSNAQLFSNCVIVSDENGEISLGHQKKVETLMMARALFVRKRAPIHERYQRFVEGLDFNLSHVRELKNLHRVVFGDLKMIPA